MDFSLEARASRSIAGFDERPTSTSSFALEGPLAPRDGSINIDEMAACRAEIQSAWRGGAYHSSETAFLVRVDSAGIRRRILLAWYRAFALGNGGGRFREQYFTGGAALSGWPLKLEAAAFSSHGGKISLPGFAGTFRVAPCAAAWRETVCPRAGVIAWGALPKKGFAQES